jgi:hypothetical protein
VKLSKHFQISDAEAEKMVEQEFWNMQRTNHPHIIKHFGHLWPMDLDGFWMVLR